MTYRYTDSNGMNTIVSSEDIRQYDRFPMLGDLVVRFFPKNYPSNYFYTGIVIHVPHVSEKNAGYVKIFWSSGKSRDYCYSGYSLWFFVKSINIISVYRDGEVL